MPGPSSIHRTVLRQERIEVQGLADGLIEVFLVPKSLLGQILRVSVHLLGRNGSRCSE